MELIVISFFHETKIPTVDMKVYMYSNFSKNKIWIKIKSPSSMRNGRFHTLKISPSKNGGVVHPFSQKA
jgi:hypothetical protein